jgi:hypothetical protein
MITRHLAPATLFVVLGVSACQTAPTANSGFIGGYDQLETQGDTLRASIRQRRDEAAAASIDRVWLEPSVLVGDAGQSLSEIDRGLVLREVDRQVCYEISERFTVSPTSDGVSRVRTAIVDIRPTGAAGSGVAAITNALVPGPGTFRVPGTTGGLAAEAELLDPQGTQVAALAWARNANVVGTDTPSLSRVGDALQMAEPFGDAVGDAFAPNGRPVRAIPDPDPCIRFGPRTQPVGFVTRLVTGLYVPEVNTGAREDAPGADRPKP